jgi:uroporphyrinogen-III synthase
VKVLVTRPLAKARLLGEKLAAKGHHPLVCPLLQINHLHPQLALKDYAALAFTSANGVEAVGGEIADYAGKLFAVGEKTAHGLRQLGLSPQVSGGGVEALGDLIIKNHGPTRGALLHLAGADTAGDLLAHLNAAGINAQRLVVYRAVALQNLPGEVKKAIESKEIDAALFYSARTAATFKALVSATGLLNCFEGTRAIVLSENVRQALNGLEFDAVDVVADQSEAAVLRALG